MVGFYPKNENNGYKSILVTRDQNIDLYLPMSLIQFKTFNHNENFIFVEITKLEIPCTFVGP